MSKKDPRQVTFFADAQGRHIPKELQRQLPGHKISAVLKPGATAAQVTNALEQDILRLNQGDCIVIMAGMNGGLNCTIHFYDAFIKVLASHPKLKFFVCNLPRNFAVRRNSSVARKARVVNKFMKQAVVGVDNVHVVDVHLLADRGLFTSDGYGFTKEGKSLVAALIAYEIRCRQLRWRE